MTYICKICGTDNETSEFYKGLTSRCKECHKRKMKENRAEKSDYYKAYDAKRFQEDPKVRERHRRYQATEAGKASMNKSRQKWILQNPEKRAAHIILWSSINRGELQKPDVCSDCGSGGRIGGHHYDYTKPLDVEWLCPMCHTARHK